MRKVYILPNLFTAGCLFSGVLAIFNILDGGDPVHSIYFILLAGICDVMDGLVARMTKTQSSFGLNFDSLADVVSFGAAPATIIYMSIHGANPVWARASCGLYVVCGALRLARFNVQAFKEEKREFLGMPIPGAACAVLSPFWLLHLRPEVAQYFPMSVVLPPVMVIIAYMMVSRFPYLGLKSLRVSGRQPFEILVMIVVLISLLMVMKDNLDVILLGLMIPYTLSGPWIRYRLRGEAPAEMLAIDEDDEDGIHAESPAS